LKTNSRWKPIWGSTPNFFNVDPIIDSSSLLKPEPTFKLLSSVSYRPFDEAIGAVDRRNLYFVR